MSPKESLHTVGYRIKDELRFIEKINSLFQLLHSWYAPLLWTIPAETPVALRTHAIPVGSSIIACSVIHTKNIRKNPPCPNELVDISIDKEKIIITPIGEKEYSLDELLEGVSEDNLHGECPVPLFIAK